MFEKYFQVTDEFLIKSIRADENDYFREFVFQSTRTPAQQHKFPLRIGPQKDFTVTGEGIFERSTKKPQYTKAEKLPFSKATPTSYVSPEITTPVFGFNRDRNEKLIGVMYSFDNVKFTKRFYKYDGGTIGRPYDHPTKEEAEKYAKEKINTILFPTLESFKQALIKDNNPNSYNEVLARVKWSNDGGAALFIATDNLESRLISQDRARILCARLKEQAAELGVAWDPTYQIPIYFYEPGEKSHLTLYDADAQAADCQLANEIFFDPDQRAAKDVAGDFEYLLAIDNPRDHYTDEEWFPLITRLSVNNRLAWSLLEKMPFYQTDPSYRGFLERLMIEENQNKPLIEMFDLFDEYQMVLQRALKDLLLFGSIPIHELDRRARLRQAALAPDIEDSELLALLISHQDVFDEVFLNFSVRKALKYAQWGFIQTLLPSYSHFNLKKELIDEVLKAASSAGQVPLIMVMMNLPEHNRPTSAAIGESFREAAAVAQLPVVQYFIQHFNNELLSDPYYVDDALTKAAAISGVSFFTVTDDPRQTSFAAMASVLVGTDGLLFFNDELFYADNKQQTISSVIIPADSYAYDKVKEAATTSPQVQNNFFQALVESVTGQRPGGRLDLVQAIFSLLPNNTIGTDAVGHALISATRSGRLNIVDFLLNSTGQHTPNSSFVGRALEIACQNAEFVMIRRFINVPPEQQSSSEWNGAALKNLISWCSIYPEAVEIVYELLNTIPEDRQPDVASVDEVLKQAIYRKPSIAVSILKRDGTNRPSAAAIRESLIFAVHQGQQEIVQQIVTMTGENKPTSNIVSQALFESLYSKKYDLFSIIMTSIPAKDRLALLQLRDGSNGNLLHRIIYSSCEEQVRQVTLILTSISTAECLILITEPKNKDSHDCGYAMELAIDNSNAIELIKLLLEIIPTDEISNVIVPKNGAWYAIGLLAQANTKPVVLSLLLRYLFKDVPRLIAAYNDVVTQMARNPKNHKKWHDKLMSFMYEAYHPRDHRSQPGFSQRLFSSSFSIPGHKLTQHELILVANALFQQTQPMLIANIEPSEISVHKPK